MHAGHHHICIHASQSFHVIVKPTYLTQHKSLSRTYHNITSSSTYVPDISQKPNIRNPKIPKEISSGHPTSINQEAKVKRYARRGTTEKRISNHTRHNHLHGPNRDGGSASGESVHGYVPNCDCVNGRRSAGGCCGHEHCASCGNWGGHRSSHSTTMTARGRCATGCGCCWTRSMRARSSFPWSIRPG